MKDPFLVFLCNFVVYFSPATCFTKAIYNYSSIFEYKSDTANANSVYLSKLIPLSGNSEQQGINSADSFRLLIETQASTFLPDHDFILNIRDDETSPGTGASQTAASFTFNNRSSMGLVGHFNSAITLVTASMSSRYSQAHLSCSSTTPSLSDKIAYPSLVRFLPDDRTAGAYLATTAFGLGWRRIVIVNTQDTFGEAQASVIAETAIAKGMEVIGVISFPFDARTNNVTARSLIVQGLSEAFARQGAIFILAALEEDTRFALEIAYEQGALSPNRMWLGGEWAIDDLFVNWDFINEATKISLEGLISVRIDCQPESASFKTLEQTFDNPNIYSCVYYDCAQAYLTAMKPTLEKMALNGVSESCLERQYYFTNKDMCDISDSFYQTTINELSTSSNCDGSCTACGVCELLRKFEGTPVTEESFLHLWQGVLLYELYQVQFLGATGTVQLNSVGDRNVENISFSVLNSHLDRASGELSFVNVGNVVNEDLTIAAPIRYATSSDINLARVSDSIPAVFLSIKLWVSVFWTVISCLFLIFVAIICGCFQFYSKMLVVRTASPKLMFTIAFGTALSYCCVIVLVWLGSTNGGCIGFVWLKAIGFMLSYGALFIKTFRVQAIFAKNHKHSNKLDDIYLFLALGVLVLFYSAFLLCWTFIGGVDEFVRVVRLDDRTNESQLVCYFVNPWQWSMFAFELVILLIGAAIAYSVQDAPQFFNETRLIAFAIYNWIVISILGQLINVVTDLPADSYYTLLSIIIILPVTATFSLLFIHKLWIIYQGKGDVIEKAKPSTLERIQTNQNMHPPLSRHASHDTKTMVTFGSSMNLPLFNGGSNMSLSATPSSPAMTSSGSCFPSSGLHTIESESNQATTGYLRKISCDGEDQIPAESSNVEL